MPQHILDKIKYLCKSIAKVEWSGALFYSVEGTIQTPNDFKVILQDILPLDMGTKAHTAYELDSRYDDYIMEDMETRAPWTLGHIHSHNDMAVFFSPEDMSELDDNAPNHNYYLSLIVNNFMDFKAKIAFTGELNKVVKNVAYKSLNEKGEEYIIFKTDLTYNKKKMFVYDCSIFSPVESLLIEDDFVHAVSEIMKPKPVVKPVYTPYVPVVQLKPEQISLQNKFKFGKLDLTKLSQRSKTLLDINKELPITEYEDLTNSDSTSMLEYFTTELMNLGIEVKPTESLKDILDRIKGLKLDAYELATKVIEFYGSIYEEHFPTATNETFIEDAEEICDILDDYLTAYPFINVTIEAIRAMVEKFEEHYVTTTV